MNKKQLKEKAISLFIYQKLQEGYTVLQIGRDTYEFRILSRKYDCADFLTLYIIPYVKCTDEIEESGIKILN